MLGRFFMCLYKHVIPPEAIGRRWGVLRHFYDYFDTKLFFAPALFPKVDFYIFIYLLITSNHSNKYKNVK